jgi:hypothetical protein
MSTDDITIGEGNRPMDIDKQIITDLYEVIRSQQQVLSYLVANDHALVETLANDPALSNFADGFQRRVEYALTRPKGSLAESLAELLRMLDAVGEKLRREIGGWEH